MKCSKHSIAKLMNRETLAPQMKCWENRAVTSITLQQRQPSNSPRDLFSMVAQQDNDSHPRVDWKQALAILFRLEKR
jgi:hypothetical protein